MQLFWYRLFFENINKKDTLKRYITASNAADKKA